MPRPFAALVLSAALLPLGGCHPFGDHDADLAFHGAPAVTPAAPVAAQPFTLSFTIVNRGDRDVGRFRWRVVRDGGVTVGSGEIGHLDEDKRRRIDLSLVEPAGTVTYAIAIDTGDRIDEDDENNNTAAITVTVAPAVPVATG